MMEPESLTPNLIAACGMNCGLCLAYLRQKNRCPGCNEEDLNKSKSCRACRIKSCDMLKGSEQRFCFECESVPCARLRQLDKRYRTKYGMSMLKNLESIQEIGLEAFVAREKKRWECPGCGQLICVHRPACIQCGRARD